MHDALLRILAEGARTELASIQETVRELQKDSARGLGERLEPIERSVWELGTLISDVTDFHAYASGRLDEADSDFDLRVTADAIRTRISRLQATTSWIALVRIRHDVPTLLRGSPGRLQDVILGTAAGLIARWPEGVMRLDVSKDWEEGDRVGLVFHCELRPADGVDPEALAADRARLAAALEPHALARQDLRAQLARRIADASGGSLTALAGEGPVPGFELRLPFTMRALPEAAALPAEAVTLRGRRVLVADVSEPRRQRLTGLLQLWGLEARVCGDRESAPEALRRARAEGAPFDFLLVDADLETSEWEFGRAIREDPALEDLRMLLLFGVGLRGDAMLAESIGYGAYLPRTVSVHELREALVLLLGRGGNGRSASIVTRHTLADARLEGIHVLVVSADPVGALVVEAVLRRKGFHVDRVRSVAEGSERCEKAHYDFLVLDEGAMPESERERVPALRALLDRNGPTPAAVLVEDAPGTTPPAADPSNAMFVKPVDLEKICEFCEGALYPELAPPPAQFQAGPRDAAVVISEFFTDDGPVVFERDLLEVATMGVESLQRSVLDVYLEEMPRRIESIAAALQSDAGEAEREVLSARVMALTVGAFSTAVCLAQLGDRIREGRLEEFEPLTARLREEFERSAVELREVRAGGASAPDQAA